MTPEFTSGRHERVDAETRAALRLCKRDASARPELPPDGPPPSPAWRRLQPDARQLQVPTSCGERADAPLVDSTPLRPHRPHLPTLLAPPLRRGGARFLGREDRSSSRPSLFRIVGPAASRAAQLVARRCEGLRLGNEGPSARPAGAVAGRARARGGGPLAAPSALFAPICAHPSQSPPIQSPFSLTQHRARSNLWSGRNLVRTKFG